MSSRKENGYSHRNNMGHDKNVVVLLLLCTYVARMSIDMCERCASRCVSVLCTIYARGLCICCFCWSWCCCCRSCCLCSGCKRLIQIIRRVEAFAIFTVTQVCWSHYCVFSKNLTKRREIKVSCGGARVHGHTAGSPRDGIYEFIPRVSILSANWLQQQQ